MTIPSILKQDLLDLNLAFDDLVCQRDNDTNYSDSLRSKRTVFTKISTKITGLFYSSNPPFYTKDLIDKTFKASLHQMISSHTFQKLATISIQELYKTPGALKEAEALLKTINKILATTSFTTVAEKEIATQLSQFALKYESYLIPSYLVKLKKLENGIFALHPLIRKPTKISDSIRYYTVNPLCSVFSFLRTNLSINSIQAARVSLTANINRHSLHTLGSFAKTKFAQLRYNVWLRSSAGAVSRSMMSDHFTLSHSIGFKNVSNNKALFHEWLKKIVTSPQFVEVSSRSLPSHFLKSPKDVQKLKALPSILTDVHHFFLTLSPLSETQNFDELSEEDMAILSNLHSLSDRLIKSKALI